MPANQRPHVIGEKIKSTVTVCVCSECGCQIHSDGMCSFRCKYDTELSRPPMMVIQRTYERVDTLVSEAAA